MISIWLQWPQCQTLLLSFWLCWFMNERSNVSRLHSSSYVRLSHVNLQCLRRHKTSTTKQSKLPRKWLIACVAVSSDLKQGSGKKDGTLPVSFSTVELRKRPLQKTSWETQTQRRSSPEVKDSTREAKQAGKKNPPYTHTPTPLTHCLQNLT